jgi:hypothetical protein
MDQRRELAEQLQRAMLQRRWSGVAAVVERLRECGTGKRSLPVQPDTGRLRLPVAPRRSDWKALLFPLICGRRRGMDPKPAQIAGAKETAKGQRFLLWVDALGGFLVCLDDEVVLGRSGPLAEAHVPIMGDLSAKHAVIRRDAEGYWLEPLRTVRIDGRPIAAPTTLADGQTIELGDSVRLRFRRPHPLSATARLEPVSRHRTQPAADGVLLMADACILGPQPQSHVVVPELPHDVVLFRQGTGLACRSGRPLTIDDLEHAERGPVTLQSRVVGENFSFTLEPL